jgi:hypothetical protein
LATGAQRVGTFLKDQPENYELIEYLVLTNMGLGDKAAAFELIEHGTAVVPIDKDALDGPQPIEILARVAAQMAESGPCHHHVTETTLDPV